jgi:hypothetical protein
MTTQKSTFGPPVREHWDEAGHCPPDGPIKVNASGEGHYVAWCLACGVAGPQREDGWEAKLAFDETVR